MRIKFVVIVLLVCIVMLGCTSQSAVIEEEAVKSALQTFYQGHIPDNPYTPQGPIQWEESGLVSQEFARAIKAWNYNSEIFNAEPFLCAQANPTDWQIGAVKVDGDSAEGQVEMMFGGTLHAITVDLVKENGVWKINATECFPIK